MKKQILLLTALMGTIVHLQGTMASRIARQSTALVTRFQAETLLEQSASFERTLNLSILSGHRAGLLERFEKDLRAQSLKRQQAIDSFMKRLAAAGALATGTLIYLTRKALIN